MARFFPGSWLARVRTVKRPFFGLAVAFTTAAITGVLAAIAPPAAADDLDSNTLDFPDPSGRARTPDINGPLDMENPFFQDLGTNGRRCVRRDSGAHRTMITTGLTSDEPVRVLWATRSRLALNDNRHEAWCSRGKGGNGSPDVSLRRPQRAGLGRRRGGHDASH